MNSGITKGSSSRFWAFWWPLCVLFLLVVLLGFQLGLGAGHHVETLVIFTCALLTWGVVVWCAYYRLLSQRALLAVMGVGLTVAVAFPAAGSRDINSYALYGRMVSAYQRSPYTHVPRDIAGDVWYKNISYYWSDSPSVYGPFFTGLSAGVMAAAGSSVLMARLEFQILAAAAVVACVEMLRRSMDADGGRMAIVLVGLNPLILAFGVNDAHCDVLMGAAILGAGLGLERRRLVRAGLLLACAVLIKISAAPALVGALVWTWHRIGRAAAIRMGVISVAVLAGAISAAGGLSQLGPLQQASLRHTRFSVWNPVFNLLTSWLGKGLPTQAPADHLVSMAAGAGVAVLALIVIVRHRSDVRPAVAIAGGLLAYQLLGAYVLSWYVAWSLPLLVLVWKSRYALVAMVHATWLAIAYLSGYAALVVLVFLAGWMLYCRHQKRSVFPDLVRA